jgi:DNA-binding NtrC family response regulator
MNLAERAVLRARRGPVDLAALLDGGQGAERPVSSAGTALRAQVDAFERSVIEAALRRHRGSISAVMAELDLPRRTLNEKMQRHGLNRADYA